jgi:hypothetical protein
MRECMCVVLVRSIDRCTLFVQRVSGDTNNTKHKHERVDNVMMMYACMYVMLVSLLSQPQHKHIHIHHTKASNDENETRWSSMIDCA